jgi:hypothetical protein
MKALWYKIFDWFVTRIGNTNWKFKNGLTQEEKDIIRAKLVPNYYIILTRSNNHLATFFIGLATFALSWKWGFWPHVLMNLEDELMSDADFRLVEATKKGIHYSTFDEVFTTNSVALLKPKSMTVEHWTEVMDKAKTELGKPYDTLFDLKNDNALSCVELVRTALMAEPHYAEDFANFEAMIAHNKNLTPDMFYSCPDFEVVFEVRR